MQRLTVRWVNTLVEWCTVQAAFNDQRRKYATRRLWVPGSWFERFRLRRCRRG